MKATILTSFLLSLTIASMAQTKDKLPEKGKQQSHCKEYQPYALGHSTKTINANNDKWYEILANAVGFTSAAASLVNANIALNKVQSNNYFLIINKEMQ